MADQILWEGVKNDLTNLASNGQLVGGTYQVTDRHLIISDGLLSSKTTQVPLYAVASIEVKQSLVQKARGVGDVIFMLDEDQSGTAIFASIDNPRDLLNILTPVVKAARDRRSFGQGEVGAGAVASTILGATGAVVAGQQDMISQLARLGQLRDTNLLTEEEFIAAKNKILGGAS